MTIMPQLIALAQKAASLGEVPVAAAVVARDGTVLATAHNEVEARNDATAHAELLAIREACRVRGSKYLLDCTLWVTLEPCAQCASAASLTKIKKVVFGAFDQKMGAVEHGCRVYQQPNCHHAPEVIGGIMENECGALLTDFFKAKR
jgi:tRNA(adenine34) deaminase